VLCGWVAEGGLMSGRRGWWEMPGAGGERGKRHAGQETCCRVPDVAEIESPGHAGINGHWGSLAGGGTRCGQWRMPRPEGRLPGTRLVRNPSPRSLHTCSQRGLEGSMRFRVAQEGNSLSSLRERGCRAVWWSERGSTVGGFRPYGFSKNPTPHHSRNPTPHYKEQWIFA
jgi:hypothetical protein